MGDAVRIPARGDAYALSGELFATGAPRAAALIGGAMAVGARFYAPLAEYVAGQGAAALTLDYRGIGGSRPEGSLRGFRAEFHDWGERDLSGAAAWLAGRYPGVPIVFIGHSAGAQLMGLIEGPPIRAALFVAAGTASWRSYHGLGRVGMAALMNLAVPAAATLPRYLTMWTLRPGDG